MLKKIHEQKIVAKLKTAGLKYQEVFEELLDHYSIAVEGKMQNENLSFDDALNCVHQEFGGSKEVKTIEERYFRQMIHFYQKTQLIYFKQQFKWPQCLGTLFIGLLFYGLASLLQGTDYVFYGLGILAITPLLISLIKFIELRNKCSFSKKPAKGFLLLHISTIGIAFLHFTLYVPTLFLNNPSESSVIFLYPALASITITFYLLVLLSFIRTLDQVQFKPS